MNKEYWEKYYTQDNLMIEPSNFAKYVQEKYLKDEDTLLEFGCGIGRDSIYFSKNNVYVLAIDQCYTVTKYIKSHSKKDKLIFRCSDFTKLGNLGFFDGVYSRFTLHAITEDEENRVIKWSKKHLKTNGKFYIEVRSTKNELYKKGTPVANEKNSFIYDNHYRRFLDRNEFCEKLKRNGFEIVEVEENTGFAPTKTENQVFMRVIASKL